MKAINSKFKSLRQRFWTGFFLLALFASYTQSPAFTADDPILKVENFLHNMRTLQAKFRQINPDHSVSTGKFFVLRPGKFRLDYTKPEGLLVICNGRDIVSYDPDGASPTSIELRSTPISFILDSHISLKGDVTVTSVLPNPNGLSLTLVKTAEPEIGSMTLFFTDKPFMLRKWIVNDGQGGRTEVDLADIILNAPVDKRLFQLQ